MFYRPRATTKNTCDDCAGGKLSKDKVKVALWASMTGEKLKPLLIGQSEIFKKKSVYLWITNSTKVMDANALSHPNLTCSNVMLKFFPANTNPQILPIKYDIKESTHR